MTAPARTLTVADFVLARLAEREMLARDMQQQASIGRPLVQLHGGGTLLRELVDPDSVLAQCEALRAVVEQCRPRYVVMYRESERLLADAFDQQNVQTIAHSGPVWPFDGAEDTLRALASIWRDHPAFDPSWAAS